ncbi:MAG: InlB B-repeat-containing protein, partial [Flavobacteriaceae bacterium]
MRNILSIIFFVSLFITGCTKEYILSVNVTPSGSGQVVPDMGTFDEGSSVTLSAIPSSEYVFERWSGAASGSSNPIQVSMNSDKNITAQFALKKYPLNIETVGSGAVNETIISTGKGTEYDSGTIVRLEAIPSTGYYFSQWSGDLNGAQNPATITIGEPKSVVARFEKEDYLVDIKVSGEGEVIKEILNTNKSDEYPYGTRLRLTPEPKDGNIFLGWVVDGIASTDSIIEVDVDNVRKITASFENELASELLRAGVGKWKVRRRIGTSKTTSFSNIIRSIQYGLSISSSSTSTIASEIGFPQFFKLYALLEFEKSTTSEGEIIAVERYQSISLVDIFVNNNGISVLDLNPIESPIIVDPNPGQTVSTATSTNTVSQDLYSYSTQGEVQINSLENGQFNASFDLNFTPTQVPSTDTSTSTILDTFEVEDEVTSDIDDNFQIGSIYIPLDYVEQRLVESGIDDIVDGYVKESLLLGVESINLS